MPPRLIVGLILATGLGTEIALGSGFALAQTGNDRSQAIKICVNNLLFQQIFSDGSPGGARTIINQGDAAIACQGVSNLQQAYAAKLCVNGLLFKSTFSDGTPSGPPTGLDTRNAAIACAICPNPILPTAP
jgi:hypothetical protein